MQLLPETQQQVGSLWKLLMCVISAEHRTPLSLHPSKITWCHLNRLDFSFVIETTVQIKAQIEQMTNKNWKIGIKP